MDLFDKCSQYDRARRIREAGHYPYYKTIESGDGPDVVIDGRPVIMAGSNNYLGLTTDPKVVAAAKAALDRYGTGACASRFMAGTLRLHVELERRLARFLGYEDALVLSTGYQTPQAIIPVLTQRGDFIFSDKDNHASIMRANVMATGSGARVLRYRHNDMQHLEELLGSVPSSAPKLIVTDGVFSATGVIADLPRIVELAHCHNARIMCDDAHATGVIGPGGRGTAAHFGLGAGVVDITMGTFSKALASQGGFVAGRRDVIEFLRNVAPPLMFSASPPPPVAAAALTALDVIESEPERIRDLHRNVASISDRLRAAGFAVVSPGGTGILSLLVGDEVRTFEMTKAALDAGIYVNAFVRPAVQPGGELIRTSYMATHKPHHLDKIVDTLVNVGKQFGLLNAPCVAE